MLWGCIALCCFHDDFYYWRCIVLYFPVLMLLSSARRCT